MTVIRRHCEFAGTEFIERVIHTSLSLSVQLVIIY